MKAKKSLYKHMNCIGIMWSESSCSSHLQLEQLRINLEGLRESVVKDIKIFLVLWIFECEFHTMTYLKKKRQYFSVAN